LPALTGSVVLKESLESLPAAPWKVMLGAWTPRDGGLWGSQNKSDKQGAALRAPLGITDGIIEYQISFDGANRHSLRIDAGPDSGSFRIEISPKHVGLTKNPAPGEDRNATEPLARKALALESRTWYPVRITFKGEKATVQVGNTIIEGSHAILAQTKPAMNFLVFDAAAGFKNLIVTH
jgi:hypothetical protein